MQDDFLKPITQFEFEPTKTASTMATIEAVRKFCGRTYIRFAMPDGTSLSTLSDAPGLYEQAINDIGQSVSLSFQYQ